MRLKDVRVMTAMFILLGRTLSNAFAQTGDSKPLTDLPRQYAATAIGEAGTLAGKSFRRNCVRYRLDN